ncbi:MAG TPA: DNA gyrase inhibitor YacG [Methylophilus sp.]|nr:DNA gyrase inhibitor YacG [Methylophilus sp.]HQQ33622.1 DNA gyrase inhibitor YacG [Methylophilus sp.]
MAKPRMVACPQCGALTEYSPSNPYRPFCSQRCKLIDLGAWANEEFRISDNTPPEDLQTDNLD